MRHKHVLLDCDGVLLDWFTPFAEFLYPKGLYGMNYYEYDIDKMFDISYEDAMKYVREFNKSETFSKLKPFNGAVETLRKLHDIGYKLIVITACGDNDIVKDLRVKNLVEVFGDVFDDILFVEEGASKMDVLSQFNPLHTEYFWVEDYVERAKEGLTLGFKTILMGKVYNERVDHGLPVAITWDDVYDFIQQKT